MSWSQISTAFMRWVDNDAGASVAQSRDDAPGIDWPRVLPYVLLHLACLGVFWVDASAFALGACVLLFALRMFAVTAFYHRYFSHRAFRTSRATQFAFALLGATAAQRGPLWWASHHRHHHAHADRLEDSHSPVVHGFLRSHVGWFLDQRNFATRLSLVPDLARYPELRWLDRFDVLMPVLLGLGLYALGHGLQAWAPELGTDGLQLFVWGFCVSTVLLHHATFTVNSLAHRFGIRRYATRDDSRNNFWLALLTMGEGWHNNHHHFPGSARQGFHWWEIDLSYYGLRLLAAIGLVWDLRPVPPGMREARQLIAPEKRP